MKIDIEQQDLKQGLLGLVMALVEVIKDALEKEAVRRVEGGSLSENQVERLGLALIDLNRAIEKIKDEHQLEEVIFQVRDSLDNLVSDVVETIAAPGMRDMAREKCCDRTNRKDA